MLNSIIQYTLIYIVNVIITSVIVSWDILKYAVNNATVSLPFFIIILLIIAFLVVLNLITWFWVWVVYFLDQLIKTLFNLFVIDVLNGFSSVFGLIVPLLGTVNEIIIAMVISFWEYFCPEQNLGVCTEPERLLFIFFDFANSFAIFFELIIVQLNVYRALIFQFICDLAIYKPEFETFFCVNDFRYKFIDRIVANETFSYINQQVYDDIASVMEVVGSFARFMVKEGIDYAGRALIFLMVESLIIFKYFLIASVVILQFALAVIVGIIYSAHPPKARGPEFNITLTTPTFEQTFDLYASRFTNQILLIEPFDVWNKSRFPCPPGYCEVLEEVMIQTNYTLYSIYHHVPNLFLWLDSFLCTMKHLHSCGKDFGICEFLFGDDAIFREFLKLIFQQIDAWLPSFLDNVMDLSGGVDLLVEASRNTCNFFTSLGECPCWVCPLDPQRQNEIYNILGTSPQSNLGVPCNPFLPGEGACCLSEAAGYTFFDKNCFERDGSSYTSIFYYIYQLTFHGNAKEFLSPKPFKCKFPWGMMYNFLTQEVTTNYWKYFSINYYVQLRDITYLTYLGTFIGRIFGVGFFPRSSGLSGQINEINTMNLQYLTYEWSWEHKDLENGVFNPMYQSYKILLYSFTVGCYGPNFLNYYFDDIQYDWKGFSDWRVPYNPWESLWFKYDLYLLGYTSELYKEPPYYDVLTLPTPLTNQYTYFLDEAYSQDFQTICPLYLKIKRTGPNPDFYFTRGNLYFFTMTASMINEFYELYLKKNLDEFSNDYGISSSRVLWQEIRPSTLYNLLKKEKYDLLPKWDNQIEIAVNNIINNNLTEVILNYDTRNIFWQELRNKYDTIDDICTFYSVDPGGDFPPHDRYYRGNNNKIYLDQRKNSIFNYFMMPVHPRLETWVNFFGQADWYSLWRTKFYGYSSVNLDICHALILNETDVGIYDTDYGVFTSSQWEIFTNHFFNGEIEQATLYFLNNFGGLKEISDIFPFTNEYDLVEPLVKHYLVVKILKEKYFAGVILAKTYSEFINSNPCNSLREIDFWDLSGGYTQLECNTELNHLKPFLKYIITYSPAYYSLFIDDTNWPKNICFRKFSIDGLLYTLDEYYTLANLDSPGAFPFNERYDDVTNNKYKLSATLMWHFLSILNRNSTLDWFSDDYDPYTYSLKGYEYYATKFCSTTEHYRYFIDGYSDNYGMDLPKTECNLYVRALGDGKYTDFKNDFFDNDKTNCDIIKSFLNNVDDYGWTNINNIIQDLGNYVNCNEKSLFNTIPQSQALSSC